MSAFVFAITMFGARSCYMVDGEGQQNCYDYGRDLHHYMSSQH